MDTWSILIAANMWFSAFLLFLVHKNRRDFSALADATEEALDSLLDTMKTVETAMLMIKRNKQDIEKLKRNKVWIPGDEEFKCKDGTNDLDRSAIPGNGGGLDGLD